MIHPHTEVRFINSEIGYGLVATQLIPKGTITWALDEFDRTFSAADVARMDPLHQAIVEKYAYVDGRGRHILCWDNARFVNHSCEPTCLGSGYEFEMAIRDIYPGEQLTDDYGGLNIEHEFSCACGSPQCRGEIQPDDILRLADDWDLILADVFPRLKKVPQPMWPVLTARCQEDVEAVLSGRVPIASSRLHYWNHKAHEENGASMPR